MNAPHTPLFAGVAWGGGCGADHPNPLFDRDARSERLRETLKTLEDGLSDLRRCRPRHTAIGAAGGVAEIDRMQPNLGDMFPQLACGG